MTKRKKNPVIVRIEDVDYPNRAKGHMLIHPERDAVEEALEIEAPIHRWIPGRPIVAKGGIPGQLYRGVTGRTRGEAKEVDLRQLLERSSLEVPADCQAEERCGGCCYRTLRYDSELMLKGQQMARLFQNAGLGHLRMGIQRSPLVDAYRNKMEYTFGDAEKGGSLRLGLHRPRHFYEIVSTPDCKIVPQDFNIIRAYVEDFYTRRGVSYYHRATKKGTLRHLVLRAGLNTKELMVNLVTTSQDLDRLDLTEFIRGLKTLSLNYSLVSVLHTQNDALADAVIPEKVICLDGREYLRETMFDLTFHIGPFSFFQPNVRGAEALYSKALQYAGDLGGKTVYDLYCGTGTISQVFAKRAQRVVGVEIVEEAVESARRSAERNHVANAKFICADVLDELDRLASEQIPPEVIVIDPPREGIHPKALPKLCKAGAEKIVYISCNPTTMVRDLVEMNSMGYQAVEGAAFDHFPRTKHVECVCLMTRVR